MTTFAERLRALRLERGLTQGRLAARASMYTTAVSAYERGDHVPRGAVLARLAAALDVDVRELVGDIANKEDSQL